MRWRWPWCSVYWRDAYERERAEVVRLTDALIRLERRAVGLSETPPKPRERVVIPPEVQMLCDAWGTPASRASSEARAVKLYQQHKDWSVVRDEMAAALMPTEVE